MSIKERLNRQLPKEGTEMASTEKRIGQNGTLNA